MRRGTPLGDLAEPKGLVGGPFGSSLVSDDYEPTGVPVIRGSNMGHGRYIGGDFAYVSEEKVHRDLARNTAAPGDVVFTQRGTLGQVALVPVGGQDLYVVSQSQMRLRVNSRRADARFVYYACTTPTFLRQVMDHAISTGVPHINLGVLAKLRVPEPPVAEQRAIAEVLGALDDKIDANASLVATADELAAAIVRACLSGERARLADVATITMGSSPPGTSYNEVGEGVVFYQGVRDFGVRVPTNRVWTTEPVRMASATDTLLSVRAPVGRTNLAAEETCIGRGLAGVRSRDGRPMTLFHILRNDPDVWAPYESEGTVFGSINKKQLMGLSVGRVLEEQRGILECRLAAIENRIASALSESDLLAATRDALLPGLMSGKIRVKDAEKAVEEVV